MINYFDCDHYGCNKTVCIIHVCTVTVESIENGDTEITVATDYSTYIVCIDCNIFKGNLLMIWRWQETN